MERRTVDFPSLAEKTIKEVKRSRKRRKGDKVRLLVEGINKGIMRSKFHEIMERFKGEIDEELVQTLDKLLSSSAEHLGNIESEILGDVTLGRDESSKALREVEELRKEVMRKIESWVKGWANKGEWQKVLRLISYVADFQRFVYASSYNLTGDRNAFANILKGVVPSIPESEWKAFVNEEIIGGCTPLLAVEKLGNQMLVSADIGLPGSIIAFYRELIKRLTEKGVGEATKRGDWATLAEMYAEANITGYFKVGGISTLSKEELERKLDESVSILLDKLKRAYEENLKNERELRALSLGLIWDGVAYPIEKREEHVKQLAETLVKIGHWRAIEEALKRIMESQVNRWGAYKNPALISRWCKSSWELSFELTLLTMDVTQRGGLNEVEEVFVREVRRAFPTQGTNVIEALQERIKEEARNRIY